MICEICNKREGESYDQFWECGYCMNNYWNRKMYRCGSKDFIGNWWLRQAFKLHIPYRIIEATYGKLRFI